MQTVKSKKGLFKLKQEKETESEEKITLYLSQVIIADLSKGVKLKQKFKWFEEMILPKYVQAVVQRPSIGNLTWGKISLPKSG